MFADDFEDPQRSHGDAVGRGFGHVETEANVALAREMIDLVGVHPLENSPEGDGLLEVGVVEVKRFPVDRWIGIEVTQAGSFERAGPPDEAMDGETTLEKKFREVGSVLSGDSSDEGGGHGVVDGRRN